MSSKKKGLFMQASILASTGIIVRIIGLLYRGPLTAIIGDEGNGYYGYAYNCYIIALLISSYSIPAAISKLVAGKLAVGEYENAQRIFRCALGYVMAVGGIISVALLVFAKAFVVDENAVPVLRVFAPTVFLFGILGVLRGYFQAHKTMVQTSISQILEQIANAFFSIIMALILRATVAAPKAETEAAMRAYETSRAVRGAIGSAIGTGMGVLVALAFMGLLYYSNRPFIYDRIWLDVHRKKSMGSILRTLIAYVTPFLLSTFVYNMTTLLDQTIFQRVMIGVKEVATEQVALDYGIFSGKAVVLTNIPIAIAAAVSSAMIPDIASRYARRERKSARRLTEEVIRMTMLLAIPSAVGLGALAKPVTLLLFPQQATIDRASGLLALLAVTVIFYSLSTLTNAILQSVGKVWIPMLNALISIAVQALLLYLLVRFTDLGSYALVIALIVHALLMCVLNHLTVSRYRLVRLNIFRVFLMPFGAACLMGICAFLVRLLLGTLLGLVIPGVYFVNVLAVLPAIAVAVLVYMTVLIRTGTVTRDDILRFPKGNAILNLAYTLRMFPSDRRKKKRSGNRKGTGRKRRRRNGF
ncbi:MAG: polysaccharide biosynthesis protein [Butyrivibrio sp.]|nr:polysaccharide biosynthesis protein [Butyrivibrio sp.]